ncbi:laccase-5-like isoform X1 [Cotesia glomerata]|uniref:Uncharacterized protein n=1 Tax=Cotesia glomerata TaxID=32391 RepID=A0AAV7IXI4_COTGL|nr:laccase-5-like isoform X1 [Cotesia glomerata]KAH0561522.1 hypothetical protein KQX54_017396 [Cotesia glomerata]
MEVCKKINMLILLVFILPIFATSQQCADDGLKLSTPEECMRECSKNETRKICYYFFSLEFFPALSSACEMCQPTTTQGLKNKADCECILVDGVERTVFSVNRMIPGPHIQVCKNDYIVVDVENMAEGVGATMHWHGLFQRNYQHYDGVPYVTQCPIEAFDTFRYQFLAAESGTFFYHSHVSVHRLDGQYGPLIIREPREEDPNSQYYEVDDPAHVILISDWMHELATERFPGLRKRWSTQRAENILINGRGTYTFENGTETDVDLETFYVQPNTTHRFRLINAFTTVCLAQLSIEDHKLLLIAQDAANIEPVEVNTIIIGSGERVDFVINTNNDVKTYWIQVRGLGECQETEVNQLAKLQYQGDEDSDSASDPPTYSDGLLRGTLYNPLDGSCDPAEETFCASNLKTADPFDEEILKPDPDVQIYLPFWFHNFNETNTFNVLYGSDPENYPVFFSPQATDPLVSVLGNVTFKSPSAPPLTEPEGYEYFCDSPDSNYCKEHAVDRTPCSCTHVQNVPLNSIVEVIIYDKQRLPTLNHPFHLHGGNFYVLDMGSLPEQDNLSESDIEKVMARHQKRLRLHKGYDRPSAKDSIIVPQGGWVIFRFRADNPGYWAFHCHFDWHSITGMQLIFHIGLDSDLPSTPSGFPRCGSFKPPVCAP